MNKIIVDYQVVGRSSASMHAAVVNGIKCGWQPFGGVTINEGIYYQAMVKYLDNPKEDGNNT